MIWCAHRCPILLKPGLACQGPKRSRTCTFANCNAALEIGRGQTPWTCLRLLWSPVVLQSSNFAVGDAAAPSSWQSARPRHGGAQPAINSADLSLHRPRLPEQTATARARSCKARLRGDCGQPRADVARRGGNVMATATPTGGNAADADCRTRLQATAANYPGSTQKGIAGPPKGTLGNWGAISMLGCSLRCLGVAQLPPS